MFKPEALNYTAVLGFVTQVISSLKLENYGESSKSRKKYIKGFRPVLGKLYQIKFLGILANLRNLYKIWVSYKFKESLQENRESLQI